METELIIDGKPVKFRATAAVPRLYRNKFRRDMIQDMQAMAEAYRAVKQDEQSEGESRSLPLEALYLFENLAYIMAKHADPEGVPGTPDEWLEQFSTFSIYEIFPFIQALWEGNMESLVDLKKKRAMSTVM